MLPNHLEKILYHYILQRKEFLQHTKENFFDTPNYPKLFQAAKAFVDKYNQTPTKNQLIEIVKIKGWGELINRDFVDSLYEINLEEYDPEWLNESTEAWVEYKNLDKSVENLVTYLKTTKVDASNVKNVVESAKDIIVRGNNIDFKFDEGLDFFNPESHKQPTLDTFSTGFPYLDTVLNGGWSTKALYVIAGENKVGKSIWLANLAAQSVKLGYNSAVISLEMRDRHVVKRLGANMLGISMKEYADMAEDQDLIKKKLATVGMDDLKIPGKLYIKEFPTSSASIKDVERWLLKMEQLKGIKFKTVFIDYINILMNWRNPNSENMYLKIKQIAEDMRAMGTRNNWAVITLTQLNRSGFGASGQISLSSIAESSGLGHTVDWMGGIIQDEVMYANCEYMLQTMLNRNEGYKNSRKKFSIDYSHMRILEDLSSQIILDTING
jgi:archaellum biogenesis ATPase FlaH